MFDFFAKAPLSNFIPRLDMQRFLVCFNDFAAIVRRADFRRFDGDFFCLQAERFGYLLACKVSLVLGNCFLSKWLDYQLFSKMFCTGFFIDFYWNLTDWKIHRNSLEKQSLTVAFSIFYTKAWILEKGDEEIFRSFFRMFFCGFASEFFSEGVRFKTTWFLERNEQSKVLFWCGFLYTFDGAKIHWYLHISFYICQIFFLNVIVFTK